MLDKNFFNNPAVTGRTLNLDTSMIKLFRDLLIEMNSTTTRPNIKISKPKSESLYGLTSNNQFLKAIPMSQSVHRMVVYGVSFSNYFKYPKGS